MSIRKNTMWSLLGSAAPMLIGVVANPNICKHAGVERIGILATICVLIGYFSIFDFGLDGAIAKHIGFLSSGHINIQMMMIATTHVFLTLIIGELRWLFGFAFIELTVLA